MGRERRASEGSREERGGRGEEILLLFFARAFVRFFFLLAFVALFVSWFLFVVYRSDVFVR